MNKKAFAELVSSDQDMGRPPQRRAEEHRPMDQGRPRGLIDELKSPLK